MEQNLACITEACITEAGKGLAEHCPAVDAERIVNEGAKSG